METLLGVLISYLISLAANIRSEAISDKKREILNERLQKEAEVLQSLEHLKSFESQLHLLGNQVRRAKFLSGVSRKEKYLFRLFGDQIFQSHLTRWITSLKPKDKEEAQSELTQLMTKALQDGGADEKETKAFKSQYFTIVERIFFENTPLSLWRLSLCLNAALAKLEDIEREIFQEGAKSRNEYLKQHKEIRKLIIHFAKERAHKSVKSFGKTELSKVLSRYCQMVLESCDIVDLANLPERDRYTAVRQLELRSLYVPLRLRIESYPAAGGEDGISGSMYVPLDLRTEFYGKTKGRYGRLTTPTRRTEHVPIGERLSTSNRIIVLGDPGSGKTSLLRWLATSFLLKLKKDPAFKNLPDVATLPDVNWIPILVRCRDLSKEDLMGTLDDVFRSTFRRTEMNDEEIAALQAILRDYISKGKALVMIDGLDEIPDLSVRIRFCQQLERASVAFPMLPIIVTSRIVGYREMGRRLGRGFDHTTLMEFTKEDKDVFANRWCALTELPERRERAISELKHAIHSSDRIERLTGNPMLLTTMALVKRQVGTLPNRRRDLYWEAVQVLLNWRSEVDEPLDQREAIPQLEYLAYEMCRREIQEIKQNDIVEILLEMRLEFPNIRPVRRRDPEDFMALLEARTGIIAKSGELRHKGRPVNVYQFRHLSIQEYLAALALVDGRFPGRDKSVGLACTVAPMVSQITHNDLGVVRVKESWREVLRLCVSCCSDDDVDEMILAILNPLDKKQDELTLITRTTLAALCLADEPNVSDQAAHRVLQSLCCLVREKDVPPSFDVVTELKGAALELVRSEWGDILKSFLVKEFMTRDARSRLPPGMMCGIISESVAPENKIEREAWLNGEVAKLASADDNRAIKGAFAIACMAFWKKIDWSHEMIDGLLSMLLRNGSSAHAGAMGLSCLRRNRTSWIPNEADILKIRTFITKPGSDMQAVHLLFPLLTPQERNDYIDKVLGWLEDTQPEVRSDAAWFLERNFHEASLILKSKMETADEGTKQAFVELMREMEVGRNPAV